MKTSRKSIRGIYQIMNSKTGESYVGSSENIQERLCTHMKHLVHGTHINKILQMSWHRYNPESFIFTVLEVVAEKHELANREIYWIKKTNALANGFNTKSDLYKKRTLIKIHKDTQIELENMNAGSMNSTLAQLIKHYKKRGT